MHQLATREKSMFVVPVRSYHHQTKNTQVHYERNFCLIKSISCRRKVLNCMQQKHSANFKVGVNMTSSVYCKLPGNEYYLRRSTSTRSSCQVGCNNPDRLRNRKNGSSARIQEQQIRKSSRNWEESLCHRGGAVPQCLLKDIDSTWERRPMWASFHVEYSKHTSRLSELWNAFLWALLKDNIFRDIIP